MGNPNVGKSVIFSRLTGVNVVSSNYPGTTIEVKKGYMMAGGERVEIVDVPGTYSLEPTSKAEEIALETLDRAFKEKNDSVVVDVVDATNLERNLYLATQLIEKKAVMLVCLNLWDEAKHVGIKIDTERLETILGVPVVPTCALTGEGVNRLVERLPQAKTGTLEVNAQGRWSIVGDIVRQVQTIAHRHHTVLDRLSDATIRPATGLPIAVAVLALDFMLIRLIGEGLIRYVLEPVFEGLWAPLMLRLSGWLGEGGLLHKILIGQLVDGKIDFGGSFGLLTTGLFVPFAAVLPYVAAFYLTLGLLEDTGYLPRLSVLVDRALHMVGLHGLSIVPMMLGFGCNVPGMLATRVMETRRERFIAMTLMSICVPCMAKTAMIVGLVGKYGMRGLFPVYGMLFIVWLIVGTLMNRFMKGDSMEIFMEVPPYRLPSLATLMKKLWMRTSGFLREAVPFVLVGVLIVNILYSSGIIAFVGRYTEPVMRGLFGLPTEAVGALLVGFLRKDIAVGMLVPLNLSLKQMIIACVILSMYFPCFATFAVMLRELGFRDMLKAILIMLLSTAVVGGLLNLLL